MSRTRNETMSQVVADGHKRNHCHREGTTNGTRLTLKNSIKTIKYIKNISLGPVVPSIFQFLIRGVLDETEAGKIHTNINKKNAVTAGTRPKILY